MDATISTTLPFIGDNLFEPILSDRLILRPLLLSDLQAFYTLRSQPEAMAHSNKGKPDANIDETFDKLKRLQPPYHDSHLYFGIFLKKSDGTEGDLIGDGGVHKFVSTKTGWPEFGYKFKKAYWGQGYATEFALAFIGFWLSLPRTQRSIQVTPSSIYHQDTLGTTELIYAWTTSDNKSSQRVLQKAGFESFKGLDNGLINWRKVLFKK